MHFLMRKDFLDLFRNGPFEVNFFICEIDHIEYYKIGNFMLISKMQKCLSEVKVKMKN
jgi:hypothetical protein